MRYLKERPLLLLTLICIAIFIPHLDALWVNIMEARNFVTAREMLQDSNWLLTTLNGEPRYQKPPLPTWLSAGSALLFGDKECLCNAHTCGYYHYSTNTYKLHFYKKTHWQYSIRVYK